MTLISKIENDLLAKIKESSLYYIWDLKVVTKYYNYSK